MRHNDGTNTRKKSNALFSTVEALDDLITGSSSGSLNLTLDTEELLAVRTALTYAILHNGTINADPLLRVRGEILLRCCPCPGCDERRKATTKAN